MQKEYVVLVDEQNNILGTMPKYMVHGKKTLLHRAFSVFVFRQYDKKLLLQQRSFKKIAWPGTWSNSYCGHPLLHESNIEAALRRGKEELGLKLNLLEEVAPYRYTFAKDGIMENEICPILVGLIDTEPIINKDEVEAIGWVDWIDFLEDININPDNWSPWAIEEALILNKNNRFKHILNNQKI